VDLVVMGIRRERGQDLSLGELALSVARESDVELVLLGARTRRGAVRRKRSPGPAPGAQLPP
jgi:hypothetical protein